MGFRRTSLLPQIIITTSTTSEHLLASPWQAVGQENKFRAGAEVRAINGTGTTVNVSVETATDPRNPDASPTALWATGVTADGIKDPDSSLVTVTLAGKLYYRYVWSIKVTSGTGWASVAGWVDALDQG